jgi:hypothetical protein
MNIISSLRVSLNYVLILVNFLSPTMPSENSSLYCIGAGHERGNIKSFCVDYHPQLLMH